MLRTLSKNSLLLPTGSADFSSMVESLFAPEIVTVPPEFDDQFSLREMLVEEPVEEFGDPEWLHDFDPWIGEALVRYCARVTASGLHGDQPYFGGF